MGLVGLACQLFEALPSAHEQLPQGVECPDRPFSWVKLDEIGAVAYFNCDLPVEVDLLLGLHLVDAVEVDALVLVHAEQVRLTQVDSLLQLLQRAQVVAAAVLGRLLLAEERHERAIRVP